VRAFALRPGGSVSAVDVMLDLPGVRNKMRRDSALPALRNCRRLTTRDNRHRSIPGLEEREADGVTLIDKHSFDESPVFARDPIAMRILRDDEVPPSEMIA
jgi:hypothetical protein